jgi:hypothetical protein
MNPNTRPITDYSKRTDNEPGKAPAKSISTRPVRTKSRRPRATNTLPKATQITEQDALFNRYRLLNPDRVIVTHYKSGTTVTMIGITGEDKLLSLEDAEKRMPLAQISERERIAISRSLARIGKAITSLEEASEDEKNILFMTQKEYNFFRPSSAKEAVEESV